MRKYKPHPLHLQSSVNAVAIKVYIEQFLKENGENYTEEETKALSREEIVALMKEHLEKHLANFDKSVEIVISIIHSRGTKKVHAHILVKMKDRLKRVHISTLLNRLHLHFRECDAILLKKGGCETIVSFAQYVCYLTHDTEQAIKKGKEKYEMNEYITNGLMPCEILQIREGVTKKSVGTKVTMGMLADLDNKAYQLGYAGGDWQSFYDELSFPIRASSKMRIIEESYHRGHRNKSRDDRKRGVKSL